MIMFVYMLKDVEKVGMAGQMIKVSDGYAKNFLIPRKLAIKVDENNKKFFEQKVKKIKINEKALSSKAAMLAEKINNLHLIIKKRTHDEGKLYGAISADEVVELLKEKDISINRKQVEFNKTIKSEGEYKVTIRLSSKLKPQLTLKVVAIK
ncbi:50S ribosomal protein L9 [Candidatus Dependentiae bacterium]|nr:50S ribosomal protein L9 [Candidatus Dependentiae bacterium]